MRGSVRKRGKKGKDGLESWQIRICIGKKPDGSPELHEETLRGKKDDADRLLRKRLDEFDSGRLARPTKDTVEAYFREWLKTTAGKRSARTNQDYLALLERYLFPELGGDLLQRLNALKLQRLYQKMEAAGLSARTIHFTHAVVRCGLKQAVRWRFLAYNPSGDVELPKAKRPGSSIRALSAHQARAFLAAIVGDRYQTLFLLALDSGMRPEEYLGLRWPSVDLDGGRVLVEQVLVRLRNQKAQDPEASTWRLEPPKTPGSRRWIALNAPTVAALRAHKARQAEERLALGPAYENRGFVFATQTGGPVQIRRLQVGHFKPALKRAGLSSEVRLYDLRHSMATLLLEAGEVPRVVSERLGHATVAMTLNVYCSVLPTMQQSAAQKLGQVLFGV